MNGNGVSRQQQSRISRHDSTPFSFRFSLAPVYPSQQCLSLSSFNPRDSRFRDQVSGVACPSRRILAVHHAIGRTAVQPVQAEGSHEAHE